MRGKGIIDTHGHLGEWFFPIPRYSLDEVDAILARYDIELCIFSSALAVMHDFREGNAWLKHAIAGRQRMAGYVTINPHYPDESRADLDAYLPLPNFLGVKYHTHYTNSRADSPLALKLLEDVQQRGVPILLHASAGQIANVAKALPDLRLIMPHFTLLAGPEASLLAGLPNVWVDFSGTDSHWGRVSEAVELLGHQRVLFGSDVTLIDPARALGMVDDADLTEEQCECILRRNAVDLFGLAKA